MCGKQKLQLVSIIDLILISTGYTARYSECRMRKGNVTLDGGEELLI